MPCNQKIFQAIENDCTPTKGVAPIAKWAFRSDIAFTFVDNTITAIATPTLPLGLFKSFKFGLNAGHEIKVFENYPDRFTHKFMGVSSEATDALDAVDDIVVFVQPNAGTTWKVYGAKNGLWKTSQSFMTNDNMGTVAFEFGSREGLEEVFECYNTSIDISALVDMDSFDLIYGGSSSSSSTIKLTVDSDKTGYIKLPNGTILITTAGAIDTTYSGVSGYVTRYVPKNNTGFISMVGSTTIGEVTYTGNKRIEFSVIAGITGFTSNTVDRVVGIGCTHLVNAVCPKSNYINLSSCALTAKSIGDILYSAYIDNRQNVYFNFSGGDNALQSDVDAYLLSKYGVSYATIYALLDVTGTILIDTI